MPKSITPSTPLDSAFEHYLATVRDARSEHTYRAYRRATQAFLLAIKEAKLGNAPTPISEINLEWYKTFLQYLQSKVRGQAIYSPATENLYLTALMGFLDEELALVLPRATLEEIRSYLKRKRRKVPLRQPPFPKEAIEELLEAIQSAAQRPFKDEEHKLTVLRDRALMQTLADTGLRIFELCQLTRGQLDLREGKATIIGKGNKEAQVRFSTRALRAVRVYLEARAKIDGAQKKELSALPLFARHDWGARHKTLSMTTRSAERVIERWVKHALGAEKVGLITPHTFRHYFVTVVIRASGGDFQVAKELARHANIGTTQRYAHISNEELDRAYSDIFEDKKTAL